MPKRILNIKADILMWITYYVDSPHASIQKQTFQIKFIASSGVDYLSVCLHNLDHFIEFNS